MFNFLKRFFRKSYNVDVNMVRKIVLINGQEFVGIVIKDNWFSDKIIVTYLMDVIKQYDEEDMSLIRLRINKMKEINQLPITLFKNSISYISYITPDMYEVYAELVNQENVRLRDMYNRVSGISKETTNIKDMPEPTHEIEQEYIM